MFGIDEIAAAAFICRIREDKINIKSYGFGICKSIEISMLGEITYMLEYYEDDDKMYVTKLYNPITVGVYKLQTMMLLNPLSNYHKNLKGGGNV